MTPASAALQALIARIVKETDGAPSMVLFDGQSYKAVPTELCDELKAALQGIAIPHQDEEP